VVSEVPIGVPPKPGFATLEPANGSAAIGRRVAININPRESDLTRMPAEDFQAAVARLKDDGALEAQAEVRQEEDRQHLWMYALGLALAVLTIESLVAGGVV
jgi:hypothetical protein